MIIIGVSAGLIYPDAERKHFASKNLCFMVNDMANYLYHDNVIPVLIPQLPPKELKNLLAKMDGFVFQGGSDVCPLSYGEKYLNETRWPGDKPRDDYELAIADFAFNHRKPVLGICRGAQLLNVYFGGTLYQDLQTEYSTVLNHYNKQVYDQHYHDVAFTPNSLLAKLYQDFSKPFVNSIHHQGIKKLANELIVEAISPQDKLIEAFSYKDAEQHYALGVQWHPEYTHALQNKVIPADILYQHFIDIVHARKGS